MPYSYLVCKLAIIFTGTSFYRKFYARIILNIILVWSCSWLIYCNDSLEFSRRHDRVSGILVRASDSLQYLIQSFAWLGPPAQLYEVSLAGVAEGLLIRSYWYMLVYWYITESSGGRRWPKKESIGCASTDALRPSVQTLTPNPWKSVPVNKDFNYMEWTSSK